MNKLLRTVLVYIAWIFALFVFVDAFVAGAFGFQILQNITKTVVWYRITLGVLGALGIWYVIYERFFISKGRA